MEMAGFVKVDGRPVPVDDGGRAAAGAGAPAALLSELVSLEEGRRGLLRGTSCSASVVQTPAAHYTDESPHEICVMVQQRGGESTARTLCIPPGVVWPVTAMDKPHPDENVL